MTLTSQCRIYRTLPGGGMGGGGTSGNVFCGPPRARYVSATSLRDLKVRALDEGPPLCGSHASYKFLKNLATTEATRWRICLPVGFGGSYMSLCNVV